MKKQYVIYYHYHNGYRLIRMIDHELPCREMIAVSESDKSTWYYFYQMDYYEDLTTLNYFLVGDYHYKQYMEERGNKELATEP